MMIAANKNFSPRLGANFDAYCCEQGLMIRQNDLRGRRLAYAAYLDRLPDAALTAMGVAPRDIPRIVFRDLFCG